VKRLLPLLLAAAIAVPLAVAAPARAGTYHMQIDTTTNVDGWQFNKPSGYWLCSIFSRAGACGDADVPSPTPLRVFALGNVAAGDEAYWYWTAPPTVSIASGSVVVDYNTTPSTRVYMKARLLNRSFASQPELHAANDMAVTTWSIPAGNESVGIFLRAVSDRTYNNKAQNTISIRSMDAVLRDDTAPVPQLGGELASGRWLNDVQSVCTTVAATDAGSGVISSVLRDQSGPVYDQHALPMSPVMQPGAANYAHNLCLVPAHLTDGYHDLLVRVTDAAGESSDAPLSVWADSHAPVATNLTPEETTDRRAPISFSVDGGPSGIASFQAWVDGHPMTVSGSDALYQPAADMAYGPHTVTWSATDGAGNHRDGFWSFQVADGVAPALSGGLPAANGTTELRRPQIEFRVTDDGSGINPSTLHVLLDGSEVAPFGTFAAGTFDYTPAVDMAYGRHTVSVTVADRYGNVMRPATWSFDVVDATAPVLSDVRPDDGSESSDRTPAISFAAADAGVGVDPAGIVVTLDGHDVSAAGSFAGGRFSFTPSQPLAYGRHDVTAQASDRSGNRSAVMAWSFEVRDETPPVISDRSPRPGAIVTGPAAVMFTVTDAGTGVDDATLAVSVDGQDVMSWSTWSGGRFVYDPGTLGAGVHTVSVTVADTSGNVTGPVLWQFAAVDPARLDVAPVSVPAHLVAGSAATLRFAATSNGAPVAATALRVSSRPAGAAAFAPAGTLTTDANGQIAFRVQPLVTTDYRVELVDSGSVSVVRTVVVAQRVRLAAASARVHLGSAIRLGGAVTPVRAGGTARVELLTRHGWTIVATRHVGSGGRYAATLLPRVRGTYVFRVVVAATATNAAGTSRTVTVRVV
jgi:hypothetical protein